MLTKEIELEPVDYGTYYENLCALGLTNRIKTREIANNSDYFLIRNTFAFEIGEDSLVKDLEYAMETISKQKYFNEMTIASDIEKDSMRKSCSEIRHGAIPQLALAAARSNRIERIHVSYKRSWRNLDFHAGISLSIREGLLECIKLDAQPDLKDLFTFVNCPNSISTKFIRGIYVS